MIGKLKLISINRRWRAVTSWNGRAGRFDFHMAFEKHECSGIRMPHSHWSPLNNGGGTVKHDAETLNGTGQNKDLLDQMWQWEGRWWISMYYVSDQRIRDLNLLLGWRMHLTINGWKFVGREVHVSKIFCWTENEEWVYCRTINTKFRPLPILICRIQPTRVREFWKT